jgi:hypothetical protein
MEHYVIERFLGLMKNTLGVTLPPGAASEAYDIDFLSKFGRLQGLKNTVTLNDKGSISGLATFGGDIISTTSDTLYVGTTQKKASWGGLFDHAIIENRIVLVNGSKPVKYDGSDVWNVGIAEPDQSSMTAAATGTDSFTVADWDYCVTFVNGDGFESNPDDLHATTNITTASAQGAGKASCNLASIPLGAAADDVVSRKLYRTTDGGSVYYLLHTIGDNTTTTYVDTKVDGSLGSTVPPTNHDIPPTDLVCVAESGDRLLGVGSTDRTLLYYSLPGDNYEGWPATYYYTFPDHIRGIEKVGNRLLVITESQPHAFIMPSSDVNTFYDIELPARIPTKSFTSLTRFLDQLLYRGPRGIYMTDGLSVKYMSQGQEDLFDVITTTQELEASETSAYYITADIVFTEEAGTPVAMSDAQGNTYSFSSEYGIVIDIADSDTYSFSAETGVIANLASDATASEVLLIDLIYDNTHSRMSDSFNCFAYDYQNDIMYGGDAVGVKQMFAGSRRNWSWKSEWSYLNFPTHYKRFDRAYIYVDGNVTFNIYLDNSSTAAFTKAITSTSMSQQEIWITPSVRGHIIQFEFVSEAGGAVDPPFVVFFETERMDRAQAGGA